VEVQLGAAGEEGDTAVTERRAAVPWLLTDGVGDDPYGADEKSANRLAPHDSSLVEAALRVIQAVP